MIVHNFNHISGTTRVSRATIGNLNITSGTFNVTGAGASSLGNLRFEGGLLTSTGISKVVSATGTLITGTNLKTISHVTLSSTDIAVLCGSVQCDLLSLSASLTTPQSLLLKRKIKQHS